MISQHCIEESACGYSNTFDTICATQIPTKNVNNGNWFHVFSRGKVGFQEYSAHYIVEATLMKKMPKFYQHFFSNVFNENTDTKTTVQTREKSLYSSYDLRMSQIFKTSPTLGLTD